MKALNLSDPQISGIRKRLENCGKVLIGGSGGGVNRIFNAADLVAAGFQATNKE